MSNESRPASKSADLDAEPSALAQSVALLLIEHALAERRATSAEHRRRVRAYRHPFSVAGRVAYGAWRSIVTGGWE